MGVPFWGTPSMYVWRKYKNIAWCHTESVAKVTSEEGRGERGQGENKPLPELWVTLLADPKAAWSKEPSTPDLMPGLQQQEAGPPGPLPSPSSSPRII